PSIAEVHPRLFGRLDLDLEPFEADDVKANADVVFSCLPHAASAEVVSTVLDGRVRAIDFSADYRLKSLDIYESWYDIKHPDPDRLGKVPYGLGEFFASDIAEAEVTANPGCYPTSAILALAPLLLANAIEPTDIIVDSKSGCSGAGKKLSPGLLYNEVNENIAAYSVGQHRHTPEIMEVLSTISGKEVSAIFTPHLVPMTRGILTTAYARPTSEASAEQLLEILKEQYAKHPFVRVTPELPATKNVANTNFCDITVRKVADRIVVISAIDNLTKGASGAAVQNMNLMFGFPETTALQ
ncbi:MAG: N-acetyl-gamma-glutamyl-phosphate reductase, partial [Planctomycetales bacterium]|nr:N-acetyl-gamma-glutamyl-phosphate reductase [Planctomycetales bacterium]